MAAGKPNPASTSSLHDPGGKNVYGVAFSPKGSLLAAAGDTDGNTYLWDVATGKLVATLTDPGSQGLYDVAFSPDGRLLAVSDAVGQQHRRRRVPVERGHGQARRRRWPPSYGAFANIAFSPNGKLIAGAHQRRRHLVERGPKGKLIANLQDPSGQDLIGVAFSPDGEDGGDSDTGGDTFLWNTKFLGP